jgi:hypothetical protein
MKHQMQIKHIDAVTDAIHDMMNGPDGDGQISGMYETETLTVTLPKAFFHLAVYLSETQEDGRGGPLWNTLQSGTRALSDPEIKASWYVFFKNRLTHMMHQDLHMLCNYNHPFFREELNDDQYHLDLDGPIPFNQERRDDYSSRPSSNP